MSKRKGFLVMEDLGDVQRSQKEKKLQIPKPDAYDGSIDANPTYQQWYETINDYLHHNRGTWDGDSDLIRVVGAYLKGKATVWYDNRARQLRANRKIDSWPAFVSAMDARFKTSHEADAAFAEMATVVYKRSVMSYIDKLVNLNEKANISGRAWRSMLVKGLPDELRKDLAKMQHQQNPNSCCGGIVSNGSRWESPKPASDLRSLWETPGACQSKVISLVDNIFGIRRKIKEDDFLTIS